MPQSRSQWIKLGRVVILLSLCMPLLLFAAANLFLLFRSLLRKEYFKLPGPWGLLHWIGFGISAAIVYQTYFVSMAFRSLSREHHYDMEAYITPYLLCFAVLLLLLYASRSIAPYVATFLYALILRYWVRKLTFDSSCRECYTDADRALTARAEAIAATIPKLTVLLLLFAVVMLVVSLLVLRRNKSTKKNPALMDS